MPEDELAAKIAGHREAAEALRGSQNSSGLIRVEATNSAL